jgi:hypothetical protein
LGGGLVDASNDIVDHLLAEFGILGALRGQFLSCLPFLVSIDFR